MTNTITKQQVEEVIEKLVDKSLTFGCSVELLPSYGKCPSVKARLAWFESDNFQTDSNVIDSEKYFINSVIGHPITLLDVLERIKSTVFTKQELEEIFPKALSASDKKKGLTLHLNNLDLALVKLWEPFGVKTPLQDILKNVEWVQVCSKCFDTTCFQCGFEHDGVIPDGIKVAKPSAATDLFIFIRSLQLTK